MLVYLAACNPRQYKCARNKATNNVLLSYHYWNSVNYVRDLHNISDQADNIFIDSGAFSAFNSGYRIDIDNYIGFIKRVKAQNYAALDVIGNAELTLRNTMYMKERGLDPIPTFHTTSEEKWLVNLLESDFTYIALGGMVGYKNIEKWLDKVWPIILKYRPNMKVHGFGLTDVSIVKKYPWHSVDSTSWHTIGRNGTVQLWNPHKNDFYRLTADEYISQRNLHRATISKLEIKGDSESAHDFEYFEKYLNTITDFSHIKQQGLLF